MLRAVLFDYWGTLATAPPAVFDDAFRRALAAARLDVPFADAKVAWDRAKEEEPQDDREVDLEDRFRRSFAGLGLRPRIVRVAAGDAAARYVQELANAGRLFPEVVDTFRALPPATLVGIVSNFPDAKEFKRALDRLGLAGRLDAAVCSAEAGRRKPDPAPFRLALERLGVAPAEAVMVGDGADDVAGAKALGMRAVFVAREGAAAPAGADAVLPDLAGLPPVLERWAGSV